MNKQGQYIAVYIMPTGNVLGQCVHHYCSDVFVRHQPHVNRCKPADKCPMLMKMKEMEDTIALYRELGI